jgi:serine phosphatase RsbU (regulator of sigma subunit)
MGRAFEHMGRYDSALHYYKLNKAVKDSVEKTSARDEVNELLAQNQLMAREQKIEHLNQLNKTSEEKNLALKEKNTLKSAIIWVSAVLLLVIVVLLVITFKSYRDNRKLTALLEHKNTEITDSINYAQRIQFALLPDEKELRQLLPNSFIVFKPKDIVSGDFYWVAQKDNLTFVAVGDCTGHGVPGGFMSMLGHGFLNDIIIDKHIHDPGKILDVLREKVIRALKQTGATGENKDGMDISLVVLNPANGWFTYAAANNPLYLVHRGQLTELAADKQPIGFYQQNMLPFTSRQVRYTPGDQLYLFTDGYADQFGGPKGKKLLYKRMKEQVVAASGLTAAEQHQNLEEQFNAWKGAYEQVDDVCMMGLRLS